MIAAAVLAQGEKPDQAPANADPPTIVGQVVAYEPNKLIAVETRNRKGVTKSEFVIVKDTTKVELPPRAAEIKVGMTLAVWADKDDPKTAARIGTQTNNAAQPRRQQPTGAPMRRRRSVKWPHSRPTIDHSVQTARCTTAR
jgi:hypothetical protein